MNGLVAAPLQFCADRRFAGAGNAFNKIISPAHGSMVPQSLGVVSLRPNTETDRAGFSQARPFFPLNNRPRFTLQWCDFSRTYLLGLRWRRGSYRTKRQGPAA